MPTATKPPARAKTSKKNEEVDRFDPRVDAAMREAPEFAQPILSHLRKTVHAAVPAMTEDIKWGRPFFLLEGMPVCMMASFKTYCAFGFWSPKMVPYLAEHGIDGLGAAGSLGRIGSVRDVPKDLKRFIVHAAELAKAGEAGSAMQGNAGRSRKAEIPMPEEFADALRKSTAANAVFTGFPPSCRREYLEWITGAKKQETRDRRIGEAILMLESGRRFNDKYR